MIAFKLSVGLVLVSLSLTATGQYKVISPDGKVTYTDQPPVDPKAKVQSIRGGSSTAQEDVVLPFATAQAARNFPVVLYSQQGCAPCDSGRVLLRARGIPFEEKTIATQADLDALKGLNRDGQLPLLTVGRDQIAGYEPGRWNSALSVAGYPANATLPNNYVAKKSALVPELITQSAAPASSAPRAAPAAANSTSETSAGFKFQK